MLSLRSSFPSLFVHSYLSTTRLSLHYTKTLRSLFDLRGLLGTYTLELGRGGGLHNRLGCLLGLSVLGSRSVLGGRGRSWGSSLLSCLGGRSRSSWLRRRSRGGTA